MRLLGFVFGTVLGMFIVVGIAAIGLWFLIGLVVGATTTVAGLAWLSRAQREKPELPCPE